MIGVLLMGIKPSRSKQLMVESDGSAFAKGLLERNNRTFFCASPNIFLQLTNKDDSRCEENQ